MNNLLLAAFGTVVTMLALGGFSVWQLDKTEARAHAPGVDPAAEAGSPETEDVPRAP